MLESAGLAATAVFELFTTYCIITVLRCNSDIFTRIRCTCMCWAKGGRCAHQAVIASLEGHCDSDSRLVNMQKESQTGPKAEIRRKTYTQASPSPIAWRKVADVAAHAVKTKKRRVSSPDAIGASASSAAATASPGASSRD